MVRIDLHALTRVGLLKTFAVAARMFVYGRTEGHGEEVHVASGLANRQPQAVLLTP